MCRIGADYMKTVNETIIKIATSPGRKITATEAKNILRNCGILNKDNQIKGVYKNIVFEVSDTTNERK